MPFGIRLSNVNLLLLMTVNISCTCMKTYDGLTKCNNSLLVPPWFIFFFIFLLVRFALFFVFVFVLFLFFCLFLFCYYYYQYFPRILSDLILQSFD